MIIIKSTDEIQKIRETSRIVYLAHCEIKKVIEPGITLKELDDIAYRTICKHGATPSFKGYRGARQVAPIPGSICASVNEVLVHGFPTKQKLCSGDIASIDIGAYYKGYHGDSGWTYAVGDLKSPDVQNLLDVTEKSLYTGIKAAKPEARVGDISYAIQTYVEQSGYSIIQEYAGHGIGRNLHEEPSVPNYGPAGKGPKLRPGMTICIEPMVSMGKRFVELQNDGWTVVMADGAWCAHFEHTILITADGAEILTGE